jgi:leader peptidase (prepilin peptidase)/N-methyltransferase
MEFNEVLFLVACTLLGLLMGSFGNVAIYRIPREIPLGLFSHTRSRCTQCNTQLRAIDNVPVFSYLFLKGKCAHCSSKISARYPIVEILSALLFGSAAWVFLKYRGFSWGYDSLAPELLFFSFQIYFIWSLLVTTYIDIDFRIIPDRFSLGNWALAGLVCLIFKDPEPIAGILGGLMGFALFYALAWAYEKYKGVEGLGFGDVKMLGWLGSWLGLEWVPFIIFVASMTGLLVGLVQMRKSGEGLQAALPFGPFLALAALLAWFLKNTSFSVGTLVF